MTAGERMGWLRTAIGVSMICAPRLVLGLSDREPTTFTSVLLLQTIGIRDLVLGAGVVSAARSANPEDLQRWTRVALASDTMDVVASVMSRRAIGTRDAAVATAMAVTAALGDVHALRSMGSNVGTEGVEPSLEAV